MSLGTARPTPNKDAQNPPPPELSNDLDIRIISAALFAWIIQEGGQAYQLHANANVPTPETKLKEQILYEVISPEYYKYAEVFSKGSTKELPPHCSYNHKIDLEEGMFSKGSAKELPPYHLYDYKIDLEEGMLPPFGKIYNMSEVKL
ncbi:hypothetical protein C0995_003016 [Termitomyces sp. Mi166|nr:hypothetical protein C0995_003016 [Termitomyces sp. Mi166\